MYLHYFLGFFVKICIIQIKIYPQASIEPKYGVIDSDNEVRVQTSMLILWVEKSYEVQKVLLGKSVACT